MSAGFTPGPWLIAQGDASSLVYALDETGGVNRFGAQISGGYSYCGRTVKERTPEAELDANAHLIAAAPELYEALEACANTLAYHGVAPAKMRFAEAVLAKARGE